MADHPKDHKTVSTDEFVELITNVQRRLYVYILSLVTNETATNDIVQNTNRVLWAKRDTFAAGTNFGAWAARCAFNQVLDYRKREQNDRLLFDSDLLGEVASSVERLASDDSSRLEYLIECVEELPEEQRTMIRRRYEPGVSVGDIAAQFGRSPAAVSQMLHRTRNRLLDCVEDKLAAEDSK